MTNMSTKWKLEKCVVYFAVIYIIELNEYLHPFVVRLKL
jgi:hypothetical protein